MRSDRTDLNVESRSTVLNLEQDSAFSRFRLKPSCSRRKHLKRRHVRDEDPTLAASQPSRQRSCGSALWLEYEALLGHLGRGELRWPRLEVLTPYECLESLK